MASRVTASSGHGRPPTLVATRNVFFRAFMRTQKPLSIRSRNRLPSASLLRISSASVIITIAINFPYWQNEDQSLGNSRRTRG